MERRELTTPEIAARIQLYSRLIEPIDRAIALLVVRELEIFQLLLEGPLTVSEIGARTRTAPRRLATFLDVVVDAGLLSRNGIRYQLRPGDEALFDPHGPHLRTLMPADTASLFRKPMKALEVLRTDTSLDSAGSGDDVDETRRRDWLLYADAVSRKTAEEVASALSGAPIERFADLGAGAGTYTFALLRRNSEAKATLVDRPNAASTVAELGRAGGVHERVTFLPGDLFTVDYGTNLDLVLMSNIIHCHGAEENQDLLSEIESRLRIGGRVAVKDRAIADDRSGPSDALTFRMNLALCSRRGTLYSESEVRTWIRRANLEAEPTLTLRTAPEDYLILAKKTCG